MKKRLSNLSNLQAGNLVGALAALVDALQQVYLYSSVVAPFNVKRSKAPAVVWIERAIEELLESRSSETNKVMVRKIAAARKQVLDKWCHDLGAVEFVMAMVSELERARTENIHDIDTEPSFVSYCAYTLHDNYRKVFDQIPINSLKFQKVTAKLRKLPLF
jgi:hypothetical protein